MILPIATVGFFVLGLAGLFAMWRHGSARPFLGALIGLGGCIITALTADIWFPLLGMNRGDGQVFIGYFLFGAGAFATMILLALLAIPVVAFRGGAIANESES